MKPRKFVTWILLALLGSVGALASARGKSFDVEVAGHRMVIESEGVRFGFVDGAGTVVVPMHADAGLRLDGQVAVLEAGEMQQGKCTVVTAGGSKAQLRVEAFEGGVSLTVAPENQGSCTIELSLGGMPVAYGLGDAGGWSPSLNLVGDAPVAYKLTHDGGRHRWTSSFAIFPGNQLAGVVFDGESQIVTLGPETYTMKVAARGPVTFHYLLGEPPVIYRNYRSLLTAEGYPHVKPKFRLFELGWESWAALGWQTNAKTMVESVTRFQELGYPIRWAVSGSGYWEEGGTTTSFGKFGEKFSPPGELKAALHARNVKWMIGQRTNFVPPGGPHWPVTEKRDQNMVVDSFKGNPISREALDKGYFVKNPDGKLWKKHSGCFPIVPCYLLEGANPEAVTWYGDLYKQWAVDGIKEDTMMHVGFAHAGIFDQPVARIAEEGGLVMARCGSFSAPGTLLRVNDTSVGEMSRRTPINYLQYAACGAPNVYSDTVGFRKMKTYSEQVVRHAWLMALTAGLAIGESPEAWSEKQQAIFKKPFDFHYRFGPYLYDAAMKSYKTGYPHTMTPLGIACPGEQGALEPAHFQWMAGESLLCAPLVKEYSSGRMDVYLPAGTWFDFDTGEKHRGPKLLEDFAMPVGKTPCFVGGKGILVTREFDAARLRVHVYPVEDLPETFTFHHPDGESVSTLRCVKGAEPEVRNAATGEVLDFDVAADSGVLSFELQAGQVYEYQLPDGSRSLEAGENAAEVNLARAATVTASSQREDFWAAHVQDQKVSDASRWLAAEGDPQPWIELAFPEPVTVGMVDVFSGWQEGDSLGDFDVAVEVGGAWERQADWQVRGNISSSKRVYIDRQDVAKVRLELVEPGPGRIREIAVYDNKEALGLPDIGESGHGSAEYGIRLDQHQVAVNQVGYLAQRPKRFTAPLSPDGTRYRIREAEGSGVLFQGTVEGGIGDFSDFQPADSDSRYVIEIEGGDLKARTSDPFLVQDNLDQEHYWQAAVDFLADVRSVTGTHPSAYGGCAWRDGTYYDAIVPALVKFYLADPDFIESMPRQIDWQAEKARVTAPDFLFDAQNPCSEGVMDAVRSYYQLDPPNPEAPDVVKLIHWGAGYILMKPNGRDPSSSGSNPGRIEPQTVEQVAYVLWAWPSLKQWLPQSFYEECRDFCFRHWKNSLGISPHWDSETYTAIDDWRGRNMHPFKGRHAPGHSIVPNLLMHEVALREGHGDAAIYLDAAVRQAQWIIDNLDWNNPLTTKGHRLAEHRTIPNLVWLLQKYPDRAPAGLREKIVAWAEVAISRSHNLWDFRKFSEEMWTIPGMNEVGNSLSLPAIALSASWVVDDPELKAELERIAVASIDHVFGRNPMLAAAVSHPGQGFPEVERGWPKLYKKDVCARLETVRGNIATLPGSEMYPFQPGKSFRHLEGWANYGASWCISLAYLRYDEHCTTPGFPITAVKQSVSSSAEAPDRGTAAVEYGTVNGEEQLVSTSGTREISGVYPHLTTYSQSRKDGRFFKERHEECGIGAVIPWADRLWMVTYAPHQPRGSDHKLYSIDKDMNMTVHAESVGGTPAARMIHKESQQLFIAHYAIDKDGGIRVIDPHKMPARVTAIMRHLSDPENFIYLYDMENMFYEVNVHTLEFTRLFEDPIPGYHGKGGFTSQGKVVVSNNGETGADHLDREEHWQVSREFADKGPEDRGCLATFDGETWEVIERRQYTEVTGPEGVAPTAAGKDDPVWAIGWDKRSLRLQVMDDGEFSTFLLPKGCLNNDARHGWFTEWPRIREVGQDALLMDMHGLFFKFPADFTATNCAGIEPISSHIRYIPDFCSWNGKLVLATDEASIQGNPLVGQPQSNLWFGDFEDLRNWGPRNAAGSIYMQDAVKAGVPSEPFLVHGFPRRMVHLAADRPVAFTLQIDREGSGEFEDYQRVEVDGYTHHIFPEDLEAQWIRVRADQDCRATVAFHFSDDVYRDAAEGAELFQAVADLDDAEVHGASLYPNARNRNLSVVSLSGPAYEFDQVDFTFRALDPEPMASECISPPAIHGPGASVNKQEVDGRTLREFLTPDADFSVDEASVVLVSREDRSIVGKQGNRTVLRLPKGPAAFDKPFSFGHPRMHREVESERMLANIHGTFYEVPFWIVGQPALYSKMRPACSHSRQISDFATWNGLLVLAGLKADAAESKHVYKSPDGGASLWFGGIDDLWKFGKPVGVGGPWKDSAVQAGVPSDPYLMIGYDQKTLELSADQDCTITVEVDVDHWTGFHTYKSFEVKAGEKLVHEFPQGFAAHWVRVTSNRDVQATAWFIYE